METTPEKTVSMGSLVRCPSATSQYKVYSDLLVSIWCIGNLVLVIDSLSKILEFLIFFDLLNFQINSFLPLVVAIVYIKL